MTEKEFRDAVLERQTINEEKRDLEARVKELSDSITAYMITNDLLDAEVGPYKVRYTERKTKTIKPELLLANGVPADVISASTTVTTSQSVTITKRKEE